MIYCLIINQLHNRTNQHKPAYLRRMVKPKVASEKTLSS